MCEEEGTPGRTFRSSPAHLEGSSLQKAHLVILGEISEARDPLGKVHHLLHCWGEAHGELFPYLLARLVGADVWRRVHGTNLGEAGKKLEKKEGLGNDIFSKDRISHQACPVVWAAAGLSVAPEARLPLELVPGFSGFFRVATGGAVALLQGHATFLPERSVDNVRAVRSLSVGFHRRVSVPAGPALLRRLLHAAVASRFCWHGDQRARGLALALLAVGEGVLTGPAHRDHGLVFAAVRPTRVGRAGVGVHGEDRLGVLGTLRGGGAGAGRRVGGRGGGGR